MVEKNELFEVLEIETRRQKGIELNEPEKEAVRRFDAERSDEYSLIVEYVETWMNKEEGFENKRVKDLSSSDVLDVVTSMRDTEELVEKDWVGVLDMSFMLHNYLTDAGLKKKHELLNTEKLNDEERLNEDVCKAVRALYDEELERKGYEWMQDEKNAEELNESLFRMINECLGGWGMDNL